jgi:hypothetical protein
LLGELTGNLFLLGHREMPLRSLSFIPRAPLLVQGRLLTLKFAFLLAKSLLVQIQARFALIESDLAHGNGRFVLLLWSWTENLIFQFFDAAGKLLLALLKLHFPFVDPNPGSSQAGFKLSRAGVELRFAAIDFAKALLKVRRQMGDLKLELLATGLERFTGDGGQHFIRRLLDDFEHGLAGRYCVDWRGFWLRQWCVVAQNKRRMRFLGFPMRRIDPGVARCV